MKTILEILLSIDISTGFAKNPSNHLHVCMSSVWSCAHFFVHGAHLAHPAAHTLEHGISAHTHSTLPLAYTFLAQGKQTAMW